MSLRLARRGASLRVLYAGVPLEPELMTSAPSGFGTPWLASLMGGFHYARIWHFAVMWAILFFIFGHLVMVVLHGWNNFVSMLTGWKKDPDYTPR